MDEKNFEYLKKSLDYLGFGTHLNQVLMEGINKQSISFSIGFNQRYIPSEFKSNQGAGVDQMHFEIYLNKSKTSEVYFLSSMVAKLTRYNSSVPIQKTFEMDKQNRISALQAYKLLCGQSFQKEIFVLDLDDLEGNKNKRVPVWHKLDLKVTGKDGEHPMKLFFPEYGFDLEKTFDRYPIADMQDSEKRESAIKALKFGNLISLKMEVEDKIMPVYLSADPEYKALNVFNERMETIRNERIFPNEDTNQNITTGFAVPVNQQEQQQDNNARMKR
ncbi:hypothetical protein [Pedobacter jamesrossensis]|uniref:Uncharacterized protein n=1 Tax=Pedobacter jamesrossensis TaxID=1908238 RepID=A0ABV8NRF7_9SPHI